MGQTAVEKILARHAGRDVVEPGEFIDADVDLLMANDITAPLAVNVFRELGVERVWDPDRITFVESHFVPAKDIQSAENVKQLRAFVKEQGVKLHFDSARGGIEHILLPQEGLVAPGDLIIGADSHSCTYGALGCFSAGVGSTDAAVVMATGKIWLKVPETIKVTFSGRRHPWLTGKDLVLRLLKEIGVEGANYQMLEYHGPVIAELPIDDRLTIANMATEAQAKGAFIPADDVTLDYLKDRVKRRFETVRPDPDARYVREIEIDVTGLEPQVAFPFSPDNVHPLSEAIGIEIQQVFIGSCTNARISDLRNAARILKGRRVHPDVRCIVIPATQAVYHQALHEGLIDVFMEAGALVSTSTCGPCLGGYMGVLGAGERCLSTSNRNFPGRMGHRTAEVYLANPAIAAATAVAGRIADPRDFADGA